MERKAHQLDNGYTKGYGDDQIYSCQDKWTYFVVYGGLDSLCFMFIRTLLLKTFNTQRPAKRCMVLCLLFSGPLIWFLCSSIFPLSSEMMITEKVELLLCIH